MDRQIGPDGLPISALFKIGFRRGDGNVYSRKVCYDII